MVKCFSRIAKCRKEARLMVPRTHILIDFTIKNSYPAIFQAVRSSVEVGSELPGSGFPSSSTSSCTVISLIGSTKYGQIRAK